MNESDPEDPKRRDSEESRDASEVSKPEDDRSALDVNPNREPEYFEDHDPHHEEAYEVDDPFESIASNIENNLQGGKKRLGSEGGEMSFLEHLEDLRGTIFKSLVAFLLAGVLMMFFLPYIADILEWPFIRAHGSEEEARRNLITNRPMEVFTVIIQVVFLGALAISLPAILYFIAQFVAPGLTEKELSVLRPGCFAAFFLFIVGAVFAYFLILPPALFFSIRFNQMLNFELLWTAGNYYSLVVWLTLGVGVLFQFPLILIMLCYVGIFSAAGLLERRKLVVVIVLVVAALITPGGDPITLLILSAPLYGLFEASVAIAAIIERRQAVELAKAE